jgi:hypothetical protein
MRGSEGYWHSEEDMKQVNCPLIKSKCDGSGCPMFREDFVENYHSDKSNTILYYYCGMGGKP